MSQNLNPSSEKLNLPVLSIIFENSSFDFIIGDYTTTKVRPKSNALAGYINLECLVLYCLIDKLFYCLTTSLYSRKENTKMRQIYQTKSRYIKRIELNYSSIFSKKEYLSDQLRRHRYPFLCMIALQLIRCAF